MDPESNPKKNQEPKSGVNVVLLLLILVTCYMPIAIVFKGNIYGIFAEWIAFVLLSFYFPIKEEIRNNPKGAYIILCIIGFIGVFV